MSYLISDLNMAPGEVLIYSPPDEGDRSSDANIFNDELRPGISYNATDSGIVFSSFPNKHGRKWSPIPTIDGAGKRTPNIDPTRLDDCEIEVLFNIASQSGYAIVNIIETSLPRETIRPNQITSESEFGEQISGTEFRLNWGGRSINSNISTGTHFFSHGYQFSELRTKKSFGLLSMLTMPTDYDEAGSKLEVFSQLNATPILRSQLETFFRSPLNIVVKTIPRDGINNLMNEVGIDLDAFSDGNNGFYGKSYSLVDGDTHFPLIDIPKRPLSSLVQLSGANIGTRLFEPTHAIGNSWKPPYIPTGSIYYNANNYHHSKRIYTLNDVSWQANDALFDRYFFSGVAPAYKINNLGYQKTGSLAEALEAFHKQDFNVAKFNPLMQPHNSTSTSLKSILTELDPESPRDPNEIYTGFKKMAAFSMLKGTFNVNSTSIKAWKSLLSANKNLTLESAQNTTSKSTGTPFPLATTVSDVGSNNGWETFSRLSDNQITTLAQKNRR